MGRINSFPHSYSCDDPDYEGPLGDDWEDEFPVKVPPAPFAMPCEFGGTSAGVGIVLQLAFKQNADWLHYTPRRTQEVIRELLCHCVFPNVNEFELATAVADTLSEMGYTPRGNSSNPTWTFPV